MVCLFLFIFDHLFYIPLTYILIVFDHTNLSPKPTKTHKTHTWHSKITHETRTKYSQDPHKSHMKPTWNTDTNSFHYIFASGLYKGSTNFCPHFCVNDQKPLVFPSYGRTLTVCTDFRLPFPSTDASSHSISIRHLTVVGKYANRVLHPTGGGTYLYPPHRKGNL